jgi:hypothetical protein
VPFAAHSWEPFTVDFGYVPPGQTLTRELAFKNGSCAQVQLSNWMTTNADFKTDAGTLVLAPDAGAKIAVSFTPQILGPRTGVLQFATASGQAALTLKGIGGGPILAVSDAGLDFGSVSVDGGAQQQLVIRNVGTRPSPPDPKANLYLGIGGKLPYFELVPANANTTASEFGVSIESPTGYDPGVGLEAVGAASLLELRIVFTPISPGPKAADLTILSTDPITPRTTVRLTGQAL